jgi:hypothetical protein
VRQKAIDPALHDPLMGDPFLLLARPLETVDSNKASSEKSVGDSRAIMAAFSDCGKPLPASLDARKARISGK